MRLKSVEMDGTIIRIGALTVDQVETFWPPVVGQPGTGTGTADMYSVVAAALANVGDKAWTASDVRKELDFPLIQKLWDETLDFSGLHVKDSTEVSQKGEDSASQK